MDSQLREQVQQRARNRCEYCHFPDAIALLPFQIDHIIAEKHHGPTGWENVCWSCERCNSHKGSNIAGFLDGRHIPLFNPRKDVWFEHFEWDGSVLVGKTPVGQVTIDVLAINLSYRVALRASLMLEDAFPTD